MIPKYLILFIGVKPMEQEHKSNPLASLMRQPKIYIRLPSSGKYWPEGSINPTMNDEYPVFSMTARDELLLKTPDALMNGQAVVDVIQSCVPNILDAWHTPNIDLDVILIAIRLATYGQKMETTLTVGKEDMSYNVDLRQLLENLMNTITWDEKIEIGNQMALYVRPINYAAMSQTNIKNFETQKLLGIVNDSELTEEEKIAHFKKSFEAITNITLAIISQSVYKIESVAGTTDDPVHIADFLSNCDREIFEAVKNRLDTLRQHNTLKAIKVRATPEMIANGSEDEIEVPLVFDAANFFD
jgi:hypothetical protein